VTLLPAFPTPGVQAVTFGTGGLGTVTVKVAAGAAGGAPWAGGSAGGQSSTVASPLNVRSLAST
jgi:hypothetical protein